MHYLKILFLRLAVLIFALALPISALAQTTPLNPPLITWGNNQTQLPAPVSLIGQDAVTGVPCAIGQSLTCGLDHPPLVRDYEVSAANTAQTFTYTLASIHDTLSIAMACSGGTATVTVSASPDNSHFTTVDSFAAAASTAKLYTATTVGGATAISPLSFPYVMVSVGPCGAGNTSTLSLGAK